MENKNQNFSFRLGDDLYHEVVVMGSDTARPFPLTGATVQIFFRRGGSAEFDLTVNNGFVFSNIEGGAIQIQLTRAIQTANSMTVGAYEWYGKVSAANGEQTTVSGTCTVEESIGAIT